MGHGIVVVGREHAAAQQALVVERAARAGPTAPACHACGLQQRHGLECQRQVAQPQIVQQAARQLHVGLVGLDQPGVHPAHRHVLDTRRGVALAAYLVQARQGDAAQRLHLGAQIGLARAVHHRVAHQGGLQRMHPAMPGLIAGQHRVSHRAGVEPPNQHRVARTLQRFGIDAQAREPLHADPHGLVAEAVAVDAAPGLQGRQPDGQVHGGVAGRSFDDVVVHGVLLHSTACNGL